MSTLSTIIQRLNQRIEVSNIFDKIFGLCEKNPTGTDQAYVHYIGNGQAEVVTNYDAKRGTIFWVKRSKVSVDKDDSIKVSGCKSMYRTTFPLTAYCVVRKTHLPCDNAECEDWIGAKVNQFLAGSDNGFKTSLGVARYEVVPAGYTTDVKDLPNNFEWATVTIDFNVSILTDSADNCFDLCSGDVPLPADFVACNPCLREVSVDGVTITGNGTPEDPLVATGVVAGGSIIVQDNGTQVTPTCTTLNFIGADVTLSGSVVSVEYNNSSQVQSNWTETNNTSPAFIQNKPTIVAPVNADWNASSGLAQILNKPTIPAAQVNSDWNATSGVAEILNKPTIPTSLPPSGSAGGDLTGTYPDPTVHRIHGIDMQSGTPATDDVWVYGGSPAKWQHQKLHASQVTNDSGVSGTNVDDALDTLENTKQNNLGFTPENVANKQTDLTASATKYPTVNAVNTGLASKQDSLGFTPENVSNKSTSVISDQASNTKYPSVKAVFDWATAAFTTAAAVASQITTALVGYATEAWVNSQGFLTAITSGDITTALGFTPVTNARTITINGTTQDLSANRTWNVGSSVWKTAADSAGYSSTSNTAVYTQLIDANTFAASDLVRVSYRTRKIGTAGAQTLRIYVNSTPDLTGSPVLCGVASVGTTTVLINQMQRHLAIKSSTANTEVYAASGSVATDFGQLPSFATASINWTAARYFVFAIQNTNAGDTNFGSFYCIEKL